MLGGNETDGVAITLGFGLTGGGRRGNSDDGTGTSILVGDIAGILDATGYDEGDVDGVRCSGVGVGGGDTTGQEVGQFGPALGGGRIRGFEYTTSLASTLARKDTHRPRVRGNSIQTLRR